jgi:N-methylhydantoinase A
MTRALRVVTVERGHDPRDRTLVAFGGAGPLHATAVAAGLDVPRVLLPGRAGVLSAVGIVAGDVLYDERRSRVRAWRDVDPDALDAAYTDLESAGDERLDAAGVPPDDRRIGRLIDLRYAGQAHELTVDVPERLDSAAIDTIADRFHDRHRDRYGHAARGEPLECVTLRVRARGLVDPPSLGGDRDAADSVAGALCERRPVVFERERETPVYGWTALPGDGRVDGPAVVEGPDSTALLRPTDTATVTDDGSLLVEVGS